jgi:hypothetical protein
VLRAARTPLNPLEQPARQASLANQARRANRGTGAQQGAQRAVDIPVYARRGRRSQDVDIREYQPRALSARGPSESATAQRGVGYQPM